ncbi:MAG: hypothetical protein Q7J74_03005, partial [Pseudomonas sp.]|nr:hypothetical protein [Pseudomonas sp.]
MLFAPELTLEPITLLLLVGVAFTAGFIDAIAGGGGLLTIPALLPKFLLRATPLARSRASGSSSWLRTVPTAPVPGPA